MTTYTPRVGDRVMFILGRDFTHAVVTSLHILYDENGDFELEQANVTLDSPYKGTVPVNILKPSTK